MGQKPFYRSGAFWLGILTVAIVAPVSIGTFVLLAQWRAGELAATPSDNWWDLVPALGGAIIGALAGGIPAWLIARRQSAETLRRDQEQRTEEQKAAAFRSSVKIVEIVNSTISLWAHVYGCIKLLDRPDLKEMEPWQALMPQVGFSDESSIRFDADEMAVFAAANEADFVNDALLLARRHSSSHATFQEYMRQRAAFMAVAPKPEKFEEGGLGTAYLTTEQVLEMKPFTIPLNDLAMGLLEGLERDVKLAKSVALAYGPIVQRHFSNPSLKGLSFPSDEELAQRAAPPK
jgi:hypothetical protein